MEKETQQQKEPVQIISLEDQPENCMFCIKDIHFRQGKAQLVIRVCTYMVVYGWRVRAGIFDKGEEPTYFDIDLCAGDHPSFLSVIYNIVLGRMIHYAENINEGKRVVGLAEMFPHFEIKPIWKNDNFERFVTSQYKYLTDRRMLFTDVILERWRRKWKEIKR